MFEKFFMKKSEACDYKGAPSTPEQIQGGHKAIYDFKVNRLADKIRTFCLLEYETRCPDTPTSWRLQMTYDRKLEENGSFNFIIHLKRTDSLNFRGKATLSVSFYDINRMPVLNPAFIDEDRMKPEDALEFRVENISPSVLNEVDDIEVTITIEKCHIDWYFSSNIKTNKSFIKLSKL